MSNVRLYVKARHLGYKRSRHNQKPNTSLVQIENVNSPRDADFYLGKRIAFVYQARKVRDGSNARVIWGRITRTHGNSGVVRAKFRKNLPPKSFGAALRIMMFPSRI